MQRGHLNQRVYHEQPAITTGLKEQDFSEYNIQDSLAQLNNPRKITEIDVQVKTKQQSTLQ